MFRSQIALLIASDRFWNRSGCIFTLGTRIGRFPNLSHNQHPAGSHSKSRAGLFASSKNMRGANFFDKNARSYQEAQCYVNLRPACFF